MHFLRLFHFFVAVEDPIKVRKEKVSSSHHPLACKMGCRRWRGPCTQECSSSKMHFALYEANEENSDALIKTVDILVRSFVRHPSFFFCQHLQRQNDTFNYSAHCRNFDLLNIHFWVLKLRMLQNSFNLNRNPKLPKLIWYSIYRIF